MPMREYFEEAEALRDEWKRWEVVWSWGNVLLGGFSTGFGALVAANTKMPFMSAGWSIGVAVAAPILTFLLTALKPNAQGAAFRTAGRELEKALRVYDGDKSKDDTYLTDAIARGMDLLGETI